MHHGEYEWIVASGMVLASDPLVGVGFLGAPELYFLITVCESLKASV